MAEWTQANIGAASLEKSVNLVKNIYTFRYALEGIDVSPARYWVFYTTSPKSYGGRIYRPVFYRGDWRVVCYDGNTQCDGLGRGDLLDSHGGFYRFHVNNSDGVLNWCNFHSDAVDAPMVRVGNEFVWYMAFEQGTPSVTCGH